MSELPLNWTMAPIGAVTVNCAQRIPSEEEQIQYIDIASIARDKKLISRPQCILGKDAPSRARKHVFAGDVLISMTRPNLNAVAMVPDSLDGQIASTGFDVLRAPELDPRWLYYTVRTNSFVERMTELVQGALYPAVKSQDVRSFEAPFAPLNEQKRIADKLDTVLARVDACRDRLDRIPAILKRFRQSVLAAATSGKLTEEWRERRRQSKNDLKSIWRPATLGELCENSFYGPRFGRAEYTNSKIGIPTIRTTDMTEDGKINLTSETPRVVVPVEKLEHFRVQKGDLLITRTGSIGVMAIFDGDYLAIPSAYLIRFRFSLRVLPRYVFFCLMSPIGQEHLGLSVTAITQPNINAEGIKKIEIQLPGLDEQAEIIRRVEAWFAYVDRLEAHHTNALNKVDRLAPALLAKAFRGELVPQDPNDEPASVLLERIHRARPEKLTQKRERKPSLKKPNHSSKEITDMAKSRFDVDVKDKPYLAGLLREVVGNVKVEDLFKRAELPVVDFYKQLVWEVEKGYVLDNKTSLKVS